MPPLPLGEGWGEGQRRALGSTERQSLLWNTADPAEQPSGGLHLGINGAIGNLGADDGLEEGDGLVFPALVDEQLAESQASASEHDEVLGLDGGIDGIAQGGLSELGPAPVQELTSALEVTGGIHGALRGAAARNADATRDNQTWAGYPRGHG